MGMESRKVPGGTIAHSMSVDLYALSPEEARTDKPGGKTSRRGGHGRRQVAGVAEDGAVAAGGGGVVVVETAVVG
jgi:hypothetical protein